MHLSTCGRMCGSRTILLNVHGSVRHNVRRALSEPNRSTFRSVSWIRCSLCNRCYCCCCFGCCCLILDFFPFHTNTLTQCAVLDSQSCADLCLITSIYHHHQYTSAIHVIIMAPGIYRSYNQHNMVCAFIVRHFQHSAHFHHQIVRSFCEMPNFHSALEFGWVKLYFK